MRCWSGLGVGRGTDGLRWRFLERPPLVVVYCHARIVVGKEGKEGKEGLDIVFFGVVRMVDRKAC